MNLSRSHSCSLCPGQRAVIRFHSRPVGSTPDPSDAPPAAVDSRARASTDPGLSVEDGHHVAEVLPVRLHALNDLQLTLKHAHWNAVGPGVIGVHEMPDPQIEKVRAMVDAIAELELFPWSMRSFLTTDDGELSHADALREAEAAKQK